MRHAVPDDEVDGDKDQFEGLELKNWGESTKPRVGPTHEHISWMGN